MKKLFAIALLASITTLAAPLQWICDWPEAKSQTFSLYQGETATFEPTFRVNGRTVTNATIEAVWYQTNGMANAWWKLDGATFAPSNDVGAASYRFFVEAKASGDTIYRANGALRMLPSPGFTPNAIEPPVVTLDFATIEVANAPYYDKAETEAKIVELAPAPGDYATVSNRAMTALQSYTESDPVWNAEKSDYATKADLSTGQITVNSAEYAESARDAYNADYATLAEGLRDGPTEIYANTIFSRLDAAVTTNALQDAELESHASQLSQLSQSLDGKVPTSRTINGKALTSNISLSASEVGATTAEDVYRIVAGTNVVLVVTNYNSATHAPAMKLQHLDPQSGEYVTYWDETRRHGLTLTNAMDYTDAAAAAELSRADAAYAPRAWSGTTSGLGSEAPGGVTWISTPETVIAGGYEYEKVITSSGAVWVLTSNGMTAGATTNSFFRVTATDGTELFAIEKTDSFLIGVNPDGITRSGNTVTIPVNVVADAHPYIRATTNLVNAVWTKEDENGFSCPWATVSWSGTTGAYVATVTCSEPQAFFYFEYLVEGGAKIKNSATVEMTGGIYFDGYRYMPVVNGSKLEFIRQ